MGKINRSEAAQQLSLSERSITRWANKVREKGYLGVKHGNFAKPSNRRIPNDVKAMVLKLKKEHYYDYNCAHFYDLLVKDYKTPVSYNTVWSWLKADHQVKTPKLRRRKKHKYRARMAQEGLMLQMDGCHHKFNGEDDWVLVSCIDDATSEIPYAEFFKGETTLACMKVLREIIKRKGIPKTIYTDKAGYSGHICKFP